MHTTIRWLTVAGLLLALACAAKPKGEPLDERLEERAGRGIERPEGTGFELPADVALADGLDEDEAVAIALWNDARFREELAALAVAEADLAEAGLVPNPTLLIMFPVDSKQLEATLGWAIDALWGRPYRVAAARHRWDAVAERLVAVGLDRIRDVRIAFADARAAEERTRSLQEVAALTEREARIADVRARSGQVNDLLATALRADTALARESARSASHAERDARIALFERIGAEAAGTGPVLVPSTALPTAPGLEQARREALATRPEVRFAQREIEAAGEQLGWEKGRVLRMTLMLDINAKGGISTQTGPGLAVELPIFDRNQGGIGRAEAEIERAAWQYVAVQREIAAQVERAHARFVEAERALRDWRADVQPAVERSAALAREAARRGAIAHTDVIGAERRALETRVQAIALEASLQRAHAELERSLGRRIGRQTDVD